MPDQHRNTNDALHRGRRDFGTRLTGRVLLVTFILLAPLSTVSAQQRIQERPNAEEAERAIAQLRSPYCPGFMLEVCTSYQAALLRDSIYELAAQGMSSGELVEWMIDRHGEEWRALPQRQGIGLWAWIIPPLALAAGVAAAITWLRRHRSATPVAIAGAASALSDNDRQRLSEAVRDWEASGGDDDV